MKISALLQNKRGVTDVVTGFMFIIVALVIVVGFVYYTSLSTSITSNIGDSTNTYDTAIDAKDKLLYCYGNSNIIKYNKLNNDCDVPFGYNITMIDYGDCNPGILKNKTSVGFKEKFVFNVPVLSNDNVTICLAKMVIFLDS